MLQGFLQVFVVVLVLPSLSVLLSDPVQQLGINLRERRGRDTSRYIRDQVVVFRGRTRRSVGSNTNWGGIRIILLGRRSVFGIRPSEPKLVVPYVLLVAGLSGR